MVQHLQVLCCQEIWKYQKHSDGVGMASTVERRVAKLEVQSRRIKPFQIVLRFVDPAKEKPDRVVVLEVLG